MPEQKVMAVVTGLPISLKQRIAVRLQQDFEAKRRAIANQLLNRLSARLTDTDRRHLDIAFRDLQDEFLRTPLSALREEPLKPSAYTLADALGRLFGLLPTTPRPTA
jgi:glutamyl-tRNA reductase